MEDDTTELILALYREGEITEYAVRRLLDDETIDQLVTNTEQSRPVLEREGDDGEGDWPDDVPLPYGHLPEEEYYVAD